MPVSPPARTAPAGASRVAEVWGLIARQEKRFSPCKLHALTGVLAEEGVPAGAALEGTELDLATVADPFALTSSQQFLIAARNAIRLCPRPDLGLRVGRRLRASSYGMYGYALLCSESMRHMFDTAVRYHQLANPMMAIRWAEVDGTASWFFPSRAKLLAAVDHWRGERLVPRKSIPMMAEAVIAQLDAGTARHVAPHLPRSLQSVPRANIRFLVPKEQILKG